MPQYNVTVEVGLLVEANSAAEAHAKVTGEIEGLAPYTTRQTIAAYDYGNMNVPCTGAVGTATAQRALR